MYFFYVGPVNIRKVKPSDNGLIKVRHPSEETLVFGDNAADVFLRFPKKCSATLLNLPLLMVIDAFHIAILNLIRSMADNDFIADSSVYVKDSFTINPKSALQRVSVVKSRIARLLVIYDHAIILYSGNGYLLTQSSDKTLILSQSKTSRIASC